MQAAVTVWYQNHILVEQDSQRNEPKIIYLRVLFNLNIIRIIK